MGFNVKYIFYLAVLICVVVAVGVVLNILLSKKQISRTTFIHTVQPQLTTIIRESVPAEIDTSMVGGVAHEIARYSTVIDSNYVKGRIDIKYDEYYNRFSLRADLYSTKDSVYVENTITKKPKFIGLTGGLGIGLANAGNGTMEQKLNSIIVDGGIKIVGKYSVTVFYSTNKTYGVRFGTDF